MTINGIFMMINYMANSLQSITIIPIY